jgi:DNA gyrase inhibitor GyrI
MILEMCVHAPLGIDAGDAARAGLRFLELPAARVAFTTHVGAYEEIGVAQHAVTAWVHEQGHAPTGAPREIYLDDPDTVPPDARRTELVLPIAG